MSGQKFAAKCFYDIGHGNNDVSGTENSIHLKEELVVQALAESLLKTFCNLTKVQSISIFGTLSIIFQ